MSDGFVTIQAWMRNDLNLSGNDLIVYAVIYGFSQDGESAFTGSRQYLADWCGCTLRNIQTILNNMVERGLLVKTECKVNNISRCEYRAVVPNFTGEKTSPVKKLHSTGEKTSPNNIDIIKDYNLISYRDKADDVESHAYSPEELSDSFVGSINKKKQPTRRKSLYDKCVDAIMSYTQDAILQELLRSYLTVRLAIKEKPLYGVNQWTALLKRLDATPGDKRKIVQQSIEKGWCSFYEVKQETNGKSSFSEYGVVSSEQAETTEEERRSALRRKGKRESF